MASMDLSTRIFQQSLCQSRSVVDNLEPAGARLVNDLQKQVEKLKGDVEAEKYRCRTMVREHLVELKRLREEHEHRLESSLDAQNQRKNNEKVMEMKRAEESIHRERDISLKTYQREKAEELRVIEKRLHQEYEEKLRYSLEQEHRIAFNEAQATLPDEDELVARENKLAKEVFCLGGENMRLEDQVRHLMHENRSQIELIRRMKKEHEIEVENLLRKNKTEAARDSARLRLGEQIIQEREMEFMDILHRAEVAESECQDLRNEASLLKASLDAAAKIKKENESSPQQSTARRSNLTKQSNDLEYTVKKLDEEKSLLKQENASLRRKLLQDGECKISQDGDEKLKRLRKRNADLVTLTKTLEERCKVLKLENTKIQDKQLGDNSEIEHQIRKTLSRQHVKDISDYTRKIASRDREIMELKRKLSKYEDSRGGALLEISTESGKKMKTLTLEKLRMEKLIAKLYSHLPIDADVELTSIEFSSEAATFVQLTEENEQLRKQINELQQPSEVDGKRVLRSSESNGSIMQMPTATSELDSVRELREDNHRLTLRLEELTKLEREHEDVSNQLVDMQLAASSSEKKLKLTEEDLEQACVASQEYERAQEHCRELESEISETRGLLNEKDRDICQLQLENKTVCAHVVEKEEEVHSLKEQIASLKNELSQGEELVKELQSELEIYTQQPDTIHASMQTSPLYSPQRLPKSSQTSPLSTPKTSPATKKTKCLQEADEGTTGGNLETISGGNLDSISEGNLESASGGQSKNERNPTDLHSEMTAIGMSMLDPYDSEGPLPSDGNLTDQSSLTLETSGSEVGVITEEVGVVIESKTPPLLHLLSDDAVSLYIACEDYFPLTMSPNPDSDVELSLRKGDYVYIHGEPDDIGFFVGQLASGKRGLVPSNYVKKLTDSPFHFPDHTHVTTPQVPPPINLELNRQFVKDEAYCLAIHWDHPKLLPPDATGYNVYVNNLLVANVRIEEETFILLSDIPRNQYVFVSVRTVANGVESNDPLKLVEINPQFPEVPSELAVQVTSLQPLQFRLIWSLFRKPSSSSSSSSSSILSYCVYLNNSFLLKSVPTNQLGRLPNGMLFIDFEMQDIQDSAYLTPPLSLTVQVTDEYHTVPHSTSVPLPTEICDLLYPDVIVADVIHSSSSPSLTSLSNGPSEACITSSTTNTTDDSQSLADLTEVAVGGYYRAVYSYDPSVSSPNGEGANEELQFYENDMIMALSELDEDGFFVGSCHGNQGLIPKNMVEHVTDIDLVQFSSQNVTKTPTLESDKLVSNGNHIDGSGQLVRAVYDYDPVDQSPNAESSGELPFQQGDYITVFGDPIDGFYEGELKGQRGYFPKSFVTPVSSTVLMKSLNNKMSVQQSTVEN